MKVGKMNEKLDAKELIIHRYRHRYHQLPFIPQFSFTNCKEVEALQLLNLQVISLLTFI